MKISKQERTIIIIFLVVAILGVGIFMFVWPQYNSIGTNKAKLTAVKQERDELMTTLEREATIDEEIKTAYKDGKDLANGFYPDLTTYEADEVMRKFIAQQPKLKYDGLTISALSTATLDISDFTDVEVTYPLKDFANTNVTDDEVDTTKMTDAEKVEYYKTLIRTLLSTSAPVTVGCVTVSFNVTTTDLKAMNDFIDELNKGVYDETIKSSDGTPQRKATFLTSATFYSSADALKTDSTPNAPAEDGTTNSTVTTTSSGEFSMAFSVNLYCIEPVADPFGATSK